MFDLTGRGALVTGASGGIGRAIASALHGQGAAVALSGTRVEALEVLAEELGERAYVVPCDLSDMDAVDALPGEAEAALGQLDLQCHFHALEPADVAAALRAALRAECAGESIEARGFVRAPDGLEQWSAKRARSMVGPERDVLDLDPGPEHSPADSLREPGA